MIPAYCCGAWIWYGFHPYLANYHNTTHLLIITGNLSLMASTWFCHDWYTNTIAGIKINVMECVDNIVRSASVWGIKTVFWGNAQHSFLFPGNKIGRGRKGTRTNQTKLWAYWMDHPFTSDNEACYDVLPCECPKARLCLWHGTCDTIITWHVIQKMYRTWFQCHAATSSMALKSCLIHFLNHWTLPVVNPPLRKRCDIYFQGSEVLVFTSFCV